MKGIPENPKAWLYTVAKNRAKDQFKRKDLFKEKIIPYLIYDQPLIAELHLNFEEHHLNDSLLQMMFTICNPILNIEAKLSLGLRVLCGFSIDEIATALLTNKSTINKRLVRAKKKLRDHNIKIEFPNEQDIISRQDDVLLLLYLLFNEGYFSNSTSTKIRKDLCYEAMRLTHLLTQNKKTNTPETNALIALFCFHTSRFEARTDEEGNQILYKNQNKEKWNFELIEKGELYLFYSKSKGGLSHYHLEALIAFWHTRTEIDEKEKWKKILFLYDKLIAIENSPITILNRTFALAKVKGKKIAIKDAKKIDLKGNHLYHSLLADLYHEINTTQEIVHLKKAIALATNENDKLVLEKKLKEAIQ